MPSSFALILVTGLCGQLQEDYYRDFRQPGDDPRMMFAGPNANAVVRRDNGIRVTLPKERKDKAPVGIGVKTRLQGDFEITAAFEIIDVEQPPAPSFGAGVSLWAQFEGHVPKHPDAASVCRFLTNKGEHVFTGDRWILEENGKHRHISNVKATKAMSGRLRLVRVGDKLRFYAAEGDDGPFFEFHSAKVVREAATLVRVSAGSGYVASSVDARFLDLRIRAEGTEPVAAANPPEAKVEENPERDPPIRLWAMAGAAVVVLIAGVVYLLIRSRGEPVGGTKASQRLASRERKRPEEA